jgi:hypothetical protein
MRIIIKSGAGGRNKSFRFVRQPHGTLVALPDSTAPESRYQLSGVQRASRERYLVTGVITLRIEFRS